MTVHFEPQRKSWWDYIAPVAGELLGGVIQNQFAKSNQQREYDFAQKAAEAEMQRKLQYGDAVRSRMTPTPGVNDDPTGYMNAYLQNSPFMTPEMINNYDEMTNAVFPQRTLVNTDLGDRNMQTVFDPRAGVLDEAIREYGVNQTDKMKADALLNQTAMDAASREKVARINQYSPESYGTPVLGPNSEWIQFSNKGNAKRSGIPGPPPQAEFDNERVKALQVAINGLEDKYRFPDGGVAPLNTWDINDAAIYEQAQAGRNSLLFSGGGGASGGGFEMPPYEPNPVYRPGSPAADRPQGWTDADETAYQNRAAEGKGEEFMNEWKKRRGLKIPATTYGKGAK
jgi:hypothetical protein